MPRVSAGLMLFRRDGGGLHVLLVHPGGPFWRHKDLGSWTIPKGEVGPGESTLEAALREFQEETGWQPPAGRPVPLGHVRLASGKLVHAWALEGDADPSTLHSNTFDLEWPRGSGRVESFPEVDRAGWFDATEARERLLPAQVMLLESLIVHLAAQREPAP